MRIKKYWHKTEKTTIVTYYRLNLSARETYQWAHKADAAWPCSQLTNKRLMVCVDQNGLCNITVEGKYPDNIDNDELSAIVTDHLPDDCKRLWPCWN